MFWISSAFFAFLGLPRFPLDANWAFATSIPGYFVFVLIKHAIKCGHIALSRNMAQLQKQHSKHVHSAETSTSNFRLHSFFPQIKLSFFLSIINSGSFKIARPFSKSFSKCIALAFDVRRHLTNTTCNDFYLICRLLGY